MVLSCLISTGCLLAMVSITQAKPAVRSKPALSAKPVSEEAFRAALAWQIALDKAGFSPGVIDGNPGAKSRAATREFQSSRGLRASGELDEDTRAALSVRPDSAITTYTVRDSDLNQVGPLPKGWVAKSNLKRLAYPSLDEELAEKFHCTRATLSYLNPTKRIASLKPGDVIRVPAVEAGAIATGKKIEVNLSQKTVRVLEADGGKCVGMFHCSVAKDKKKAPSGNARVVVIAHNPTYNFDPKKWPEVKGVKQKLIIPPGPRNPVGVCWVGLNLPGYGIHGTPNPELIGKTGSHGCIRLANWDAARLGQMVSVGTPVTFVK